MLFCRNRSESQRKKGLVIRGQRERLQSRPNSWKQRKRFGRFQESPDAIEDPRPSSVGSMPTNRLCMKDVPAAKVGRPSTLLARLPNSSSGY